MGRSSAHPLHVTETSPGAARPGARGSSGFPATGGRGLCGLVLPLGLMADMDATSVFWVVEEGTDETRIRNRLDLAQRETGLRRLYSR